MDNEQILESEKWLSFISKNIRGKKTQEALSHYVQNLILNNTPVIIDFNHLAELLGIQIGTISSIVSNSNSFYYNFSIPKRNGGFRQISAPYPVLLCAQRWIYENILIKQPLHKSSTGFIKNVSIVDNAKIHLNQPCILKMDIENFFPSIKINRIISIFKNLGYTKKISFYLASICCLNNELPQGAATSPTLSNIIAKRLDYRLKGFADKFDLKYSRYADDFTFSGQSIPTRLTSYIEKIVKEEGFVINSKKTKIINDKKQKIITGISISSGKLTIPKKNKREIRKNIHYLLSKGLLAHQKFIDLYDPIYIERQLGYLYFWYSVEPENNFVLDSIKKLREYSKKLDEDYQYQIKI